MFTYLTSTFRTWSRYSRPEVASGANATLMNSTTPVIHVVIPAVLAFSGALLVVAIFDVNVHVMNRAYALRGTL